MIKQDTPGHNQFGVSKQKQASKKNLKVKAKRKITKQNRQVREHNKTSPDPLHTADYRTVEECVRLRCF